MRLLEKPQAAGDDVGNVAPRQFHLQFHRMIMRAIQHRDVVERHAFVAQLENPLGHEQRLLVRIGTNHQPRFHAACAHRLQVLGKLMDVGLDRFVGQLQDARHAAIVHFNLIRVRTCIAVRKPEDVAVVGPPPRVNRLRIVSDNHQIVMLAGKCIDQIGLDLVRVLILIHQHVEELFLIPFPHFRMILKQAQTEH